MEIALKNVRVEIPLTVEVTCDKPIGIKQLLGIAEAETALTEKKLFKLHVCDSVLCTGTDVVESSPELFGNVVTTDVYKKTAGVFNSCPLENTVDNNVVHNGFHILEDFGVKDT